jgi:shikimate kinase
MALYVDMRNIVLAGFMGTGKSTAGRALASGLGLKFLDLDSLIEKEAGLEVKEIFSALGEAHFRKLESELVEKLIRGELGTGLVVATGGGAVVDEKNREALKSWGVLICLKASVDEIVKRVGRSDDRPLLSETELKETVEKLLRERQGAYADCDLTVDTTYLNPDGVVRKIRSFLDETA